MLVARRWWSRIDVCAHAPRASSSVPSAVSWVLHRDGDVLVVATGGNSMLNVAQDCCSAAGRRLSPAAEEQLAELKNENAELKTRAAALEKDVAALKAAMAKMPQ